MIDPILILRDEIRDDPLARGYALMTDSEIADSGNAKDRVFMRTLQGTEVLLWSRKQGRLLKILAASEKKPPFDAISDDAQSNAIIALGFIRGNFIALNFSDPVQMAIVDELVADGLFTAADRDALIAMATYTGSRFEELGLVEIGGALYSGHITQARLLI